MKLNKSYMTTDPKGTYINFDFSTPEKINQYVIDIVFPKRGVWMYDQEDLDSFKKASPLKFGYGYAAA